MTLTSVRQGRILLGAVALSLTAAAGASAAVQTRVVDYSQDGTPLQGMLAWNDSASGKRPGVLVVHEWWGHNEHARNQARKLAEAGYVAFALDMYGKGKIATHPEDAMKFMSEATKDPAVV
jgi:dienelactone hydrolase